MENKDFRERLRQHKVTVDKEAWEMMQTILYSSEEKPKKKKRKVLFFWLWFSGIGIIFICLFIFPNVDKFINNKMPFNSTSSELSIESYNFKNTKGQSNNIHNSIKSDVSNNTIVLKNRTKNSLSSSDDYYGFLANKEPKKQNKASRINLSSKQSTIPLTNEKGNTKSMDQKITDSVESHFIESSFLDETKKPKALDRNEIIFDKTSEEIKIALNDAPVSLDSQNSIIGSKNINEKLELNPSNKSQSTSIAAPDNAMINNGQVKIKLTKLTKINFIKASEYHIDINPKKVSQWSLFGQIGYAIFNENPGLNFSAGGLYEIDKLLYIESILSYSYGNESGISADERGTSEKEIDLGLVINLNLITTSKSRFALELGTGITKYWGTRIIRSNPVTVDNRSSLGQHFQGGLSYHYRVNKDIKLGLKFGVISYDDAIAFFAFKYYKSI